jgi:hypothetical protein
MQDAKSPKETWNTSILKCITPICMHIKCNLSKSCIICKKEYIGYIWLLCEGKTLPIFSHLLEQSNGCEYGLKKIIVGFELQLQFKRNLLTWKWIDNPSY